MSTGDVTRLPFLDKVIVSRIYHECEGGIEK